MMFKRTHEPIIIGGIEVEDSSELDIIIAGKIVPFTTQNFIWKINSNSLTKEAAPFFKDYHLGLILSSSPVAVDDKMFYVAMMDSQAFFQAARKSIIIHSIQKAMRMNGIDLTQMEHYEKFEQFYSLIERGDHKSPPEEDAAIIRLAELLIKNLIKNQAVYQYYFSASQWLEHKIKHPIILHLE